MLFNCFYLGIPTAAEIIDLPADTKAGEVIIKWNTPKDNGALIEKYTVYRRTVSDDGTPQNWITLHVITNISVRNVTVQLVKGKIYEFVVSATNKHGESLKEEGKIKRIKVGGRYYLVCHYYFLFENRHSQTEVDGKTERRRNNYRNSDFRPLQIAVEHFPHFLPLLMLKLKGTISSA